MLGCGDQTAGIRLYRLSLTPKYTTMFLGLSITLQSAHDKSPVLRGVSQFRMMYCYYFNIKGKERGGTGNRTYCLAGIVFFFWLPPFPLHLSPKSSSSPFHSPQAALRGGRANGHFTPAGWIKPFPSQASGLAAYGHRLRGHTGAGTSFHSQGGGRYCN